MAHEADFLDERIRLIHSAVGYLRQRSVEIMRSLNSPGLTAETRKALEEELEEMTKAAKHLCKELGIS